MTSPLPARAAPRGVLVVHEHERLVPEGARRPPRSGETPIDPRQWEVLAEYAERTETPAFRVGRHVITVGHHVGYLQVGRLRLEVLPKLRRSAAGDDWRGLLVHMLREVLGLRIAVQTASPLRSRAGDLYRVLVDRYLVLVEGLMREGLVRDYREVEGNETCLRGRLVVGRHVRANAAHRERLYVAYPVFDADTLPNRVLHQALRKVQETSVFDGQRAVAEGLLGAFPEVGPRAVRPVDFERLRLDRRTQRYAEALELARLLLMGERPDLSWGGKPVLSLLFDMNALFEAYVLRQLRRVPGVRVRAQARKVFWRSAAGPKYLQPDLLVTVDGSEEPLVIDTKWKVPEGDRPSDGDLRQLFAYLQAFGARRGVLLYPRATERQGGADGFYEVDGLVGGTAFLELMPGGRADAGRVRQELLGLLGVALRQDEPHANKRPEAAYRDVRHRPPLPRTGTS